MQTDDLVIRAKVLDGIWEVLGAQRGISIVPESVVLVANGWGSDSASFDLHRDPGSFWPDLQGATPLEAEVAGGLVWSGRIKDTPANDGEQPVINVQSEGWQYHLDDDLFAKAYVHNTISEWREARSFPSVDLINVFKAAAANVTIDGGQVTLAFPANATIAPNAFAGVILDLGPYASAASISVDWTSSNNNGGVQLYARCGPTPGRVMSGATAFGPIANNSASVGSNRGTFAAPGRYIAIAIFNSTGFNLTPAADVWFQITGARVFANDSWRSVDASILKASDVILDAIASGTMLLSSDRSKVAATSFPIPGFTFGHQPRTARESIDGVNALHNYITKIDEQARPVFQPRPTAPLYEVGAWGGSVFKDVAMNSTEDIVSRVMIVGTGPNGENKIIERSAGALASLQTPITSPAPDNPSFAVDTASWSVDGSAFAIHRDTGTFDTAPASANWRDSDGLTALETFTGTFLAGQTYILTFAYKTNRAYGDTIATFGTATDFAQVAFTPTNGFVKYSISWQPLRDSAGVTLQLTPVYNTAQSFLENVDSLALAVGKPTIINRRGFRKTKTLEISSSVIATVAGQLGDVYLAAHRTQPLTGTLTVEPGGVRRVAGGSVHPAQLLRDTGQLIRLGHRIDPDTGGLGRDGTIATVTYTHEKRESEISIDSTRHDFEALLARYALFAPA